MRKFRALIVLSSEIRGPLRVKLWTGCLVAAQGWPESALNQNARATCVGRHRRHAGHAGYRHGAESRRHHPNRAQYPCGVKYTGSWWISNAAKEPMDELNKGLFAFAAYNCGRRVNSPAGRRPSSGSTAMSGSTTWSGWPRTRSAARPSPMVSNIYKYYIAYRLVQGEYLDRESAKKQLQSPSPASDRTESHRRLSRERRVLDGGIPASVPGAGPRDGRCRWTRPGLRGQPLELGDVPPPMTTSSGSSAAVRSSTARSTWRRHFFLPIRSSPFRPT